MFQEIKMVSEKARAAARSIMEKLYEGTCDVITYSKVVDQATHITKKSETKIYEAQPCRISFKNNNLNDSQTTETVSQAVQKIKLFISPDVSIPKGSKIVVTQNGQTVAYKSSGEPMMYFTHQEIILEIFDKWT